MYLSPILYKERSTTVISIRDAMETVGRLLGKQKRDPALSYRRSKYCVLFPVEEGMLYYHTLTGSLWLIGKDEREEDCLNGLISGWAFVPEGFDEKKQADDLRSLTKMLRRNKDKTNFTIFTTTDCNARCFYCFEMGEKRYSMTEQTARETAAYIARGRGGEKAELNWFGGEPLYNRRAIEIITSCLNAEGISFTSNMTSNGYYLDKETVETAVRDWHLKMVQITLDGTNEVYKKAKAYIERDEDPLTRVLNHIDFALKAGIDVYIRLNINRKNADDLMSLADMLADRFPNKKGLNVYIYALQDFVGPVQGFTEAAEETEKVLALHRRLLELGLHKAPALTQGLRVERCMADRDSYEVIMADGHLITCEHYNKADTVGSIGTEDRNTAVIQAWKETVSYQACESCPLYPNCIQLKKCPWRKEDCSSTVRALKMKDLEGAVLSAYSEYKERIRKDENQ